MIAGVIAGTWGALVGLTCVLVLTRRGSPLAVPGSWVWYPAAAASTAVVASTTAVPLRWPAVALAGVAGLILVTDLTALRIPDPLTAAAAALTTTACLVAGPLTAVLAGAGIAAGAYLVAALQHRFASLGAGDVKLAPSLALLLGWACAATGRWHLLLVAVLAIYTLAGAWALLLLARGADRTDHLPFGVAMIAGTVLTLALAT